MTIQVAARSRRERGTLKVRQNITQMSAEEVTRFRSAMEEMLRRPDNRGFQFFAGWHGVPLGICEHSNQLFLPWHRGYLYHFELALQEIDSEVTLPWWDWMDEAGIPAAYGDAEAEGKENVLASMPIEPMGVPRQPGWPDKTQRDPGGQIPGFPAPLPPPLSSFYDWVMESPSYQQFWNRCVRPHNNIHNWVGGNGGQMADENWAAFDPIFWAHHTMVDRLWRIWQHSPLGEDPDLALQETSLTFAKGPSLLVRDVLHVEQLGYEYAAQSSTVPVTG
ncbi:MAG TPA: tyrosinase family protein [Solirubrobacterales bacterium]